MLNPAIPEIEAVLEPVMDGLCNFVGRALRVSALHQVSFFANLLSNLA